MPAQLLNSVHIGGVDGSFGEDLDPGGTDRSQPDSLRGSWPLEHVQHYLRSAEVTRLRAAAWDIAGVVLALGGSLAF